MLPQNYMDREAVNRALREKVAEIFGWPRETASLEERQMFYLQLVAETGSLVPGKHLLDLGPGLCCFGAMARALGLQVTLIDDFGGGGAVDPKRQDITERFLNAFRKQLSIQVVEMDFLKHPLPLTPASIDVITCFHSLEHWHHSPKPLFAEIKRVLKPGGYIILATPNAANLRKRLFVPLGRNIWSPLAEWYHDGDPVFRGHVREPIVSELHQLLAWNQFEVVATRGRNFIGQASQALGFLPKGLVRTLAVGSDYLLRAVPSLCSDIHVIGRLST